MTAGSAEGPSGVAGGCLLAGLGIGAVSGVFTYSPDAGILLTVGVGWGSIVWAAARHPKIANPSPPPPQGPSQNTNTQVTEIVQDPDNTHHWLVQQKEQR